MLLYVYLWFSFSDLCSSRRIIFLKNVRFRFFGLIVQLFWKKLKVQAFIEYNSASKSRIYSWNRPVESNSSLVFLVIQFQTVTLKNSLKKKWPWSMYLQEFCRITLEVQCNSRKIVKVLLLVDWQKKVDSHVWGIYFQIRWGLFQFCWGK